MWVSVWVSGFPGVRAFGCVGVWVSVFFSVHTCLLLLPAVPWVLAGLGCLFACHECDIRQVPDPLGKLRPDLGALHVGDCGIHVLPRQ